MSAASKYLRSTVMDAIVNLRNGQDIRLRQAHMVCGRVEAGESGILRVVAKAPVGVASRF